MKILILSVIAICLNISCEGLTAKTRRVVTTKKSFYFMNFILNKLTVIFLNKPQPQQHQPKEVSYIL